MNIGSLIQRVLSGVTQEPRYYCSGCLQLVDTTWLSPSPGRDGRETPLLLCHPCLEAHGRWVRIGPVHIAAVVGTTSFERAAAEFHAEVRSGPWGRVAIRSDGALPVCLLEIASLTAPQPLQEPSHPLSGLDAIWIDAEVEPLEAARDLDRLARITREGLGLFASARLKRLPVLLRGGELHPTVVTRLRKGFGPICRAEPAVTVVGTPSPSEPEMVDDP